MLSALLFDLDGTLVDSNPVHYRAWKQILTEFGIELDQPTYDRQISGRTNAEIVADLLPQLSVAEGAALSDRKEQCYRDWARETLEPLAGFERLWGRLGDRGWRSAVVTNAPRANAELVLSVVGAGNEGASRSLGPVILAEDCPAGKPDPAPYRIALERIGVAAADAIAFEDSPAGIRSAVAAGIETIALTTSHPAAQLYGAGATLAIADFNDPALWRRLDEREA
jgi:beta-phosphoglucomutase-like phosphatase (HAD superfamily)